MFSEKMMDHCQNPRNVGKLDENDKNVGTGLVGSPVCGDMLQFWLRIENNIVKDAKFKTFGFNRHYLGNDKKGENICKL